MLAFIVNMVYFSINEEKSEGKKLNSRQQAVALYLTKQVSYQTTKEIAQSFKVSERTLQSDLNTIEEFILIQDFKIAVERKKGTGIRLKGTNFEKDLLKKQLNQLLHGKTFDDQKSEQLLIFHLLMAKEGQTLEELAEKLFVSRKEVKRLLVEVAPYFSFHQLNLVSKPRLGTFIEGAERKKRELLAQNLKAIQKVDPQTVMLKDFFSKKILSSIQSILREELAREKINYDSELSSIDIHVYFMLERMWQGEPVILSEEEHKMVGDTLAQKLSSQILARLADTYPIVFSTNEIDYLALRLSTLLAKEDESDSLQKETKNLSNHLIQQVGQMMGTDFSEDSILRQNLQAHLSSTYFRVNYGFSIANPLTKEILGTYTHLFLVIQMALEAFFEQEAFYLPQEEIAYLTVHFQAAFERKQKREVQQFTALLVTQYTRSMATFLEARLNREIPELMVVEIIQTKAAALVSEPEVDFILSTVPLPEAKQPVIQISPMITEENIGHIKTYMLGHYPKKRKKHFEFPRFTSPFLVYPQLAFSDMYELLAFLSQPLVENAYVAKDFTSSLIERERRSSTRVAPLIALPHGNPLLVLASTISIATLKEPLDWHGEKVQLVLLLAIQKEELKDPQFKKLFSLIHYLEKSPTVLQTIFKETNPLKLMSILSEYE